MITRDRIETVALTLLLLVGLSFQGTPAQAQQGGGIAFKSDLPRTLVFVAEEGDGGVATRDLTDFLREAALAKVFAGKTSLQEINKVTFVE